jgi:hypothetical protein
VGGLAAEMSWSRDRDGERASRAATLGAALFTLAPVFQTTSLLATIDGPFLACWGLGAWAAWAALTRGSGRAWAVLGGAIGLGFLFKYTILMLVPGIVVFAVLARRRGGLASCPRWRAGAAAGVGLMLLGLAPVVIWNAQHDWQTVRHLMGHLGMKGGDSPVGEGKSAHYSPLWTVNLLLSQVGFLAAATVPCAVTAWRAIARRASDPAADRAWLFGWWVGAPVLLLYVAISFIAEPEGNWPIAAWVTALSAGAVWLTEPALNGEALRRSVWRGVLWGGVVVALVLARLDLVAKGLEYVSPALARAVPVGRVMGMREMAAHVVEIERSLRERTGREPMVISAHYGRASRLRFVLPGRPVVYCASSQTGGRIVQQDYWRDTDLLDPALLGRPALLIGGEASGSLWKGAFESVEPLAGGLHGEPKSNRPSFIGLGYTGQWPKAHPQPPEPWRGKGGAP